MSFVCKFALIMLAIGVTVCVVILGFGWLTSQAASNFVPF